MGVPALFRWLSKKYPKIISPVIEEQPKEIEGETIPVNIEEPNPNGFEYDNLYLDMNNIIHPCSHPEDRPAPANEEEMMVAVFEYIERLVNMVRPRKLLMMAIDGVAPRAKMNQQRMRRFRAAKEAKEKDEDNAELLKMMKQQNGGEVTDDVEERITKKTWDSNSITPGTPFMRLLAKALNYWVQYKQNTDPAWRSFKVIVSTAAVPGEGEHKIMHFIRSQRSSPEHDPNTRHAMYGLDADLIMLGLVTHEPRYHVLREDVFFQETKGNACRICGQQGHYAAECKGEAKKKVGEHDERENGMEKKPYIWLNVGVLREYLECEMYVPNQPFRFDLERVLDDWVMMCYFVGNDFLPHLPSLEIREDAIDTLIAIWREVMKTSDDYLTKDGTLNMAILQKVMAGLAKQEDGIFRRRQQVEERKEQAAKRRKLDQERRNNARQGGGDGNKVPAYSSIGNEHVFDLTQGEKMTKLTHNMVMNRGDASTANKSAAAVLKSQLMTGEGAGEGNEDGQNDSQQATGDSQVSQESNGADNGKPSEDDPAAASALGKRKADLMEEDGPSTPGRSTPVASETAPKKEDVIEGQPDTVRLWEDGYADRYYQQKFHTEASDIAFRNKVAKAYTEGLQWVLLYYLQGCPSWTWYYPYHYAPFAADFVGLEEMDIKYDKGRIFKPYEQLMGVMPAASRHTIPEPFHPLMTGEEGDIVDFYPEDFAIDMNGKKFSWQGVALLPFIDENRLMEAMNTKYPLLTEEEHRLNEFGEETLLFSDQHPMYQEIANSVFAKNSDDSVELNARRSDGLSGTIEKDPEYIPLAPLVFPLDGDNMPDLDENHSVSVYYKPPTVDSVHKSMLLRGAEPDPPALNEEDKRFTRERALNPGRGGRGGGGYGGGGGFDRRGGGRGGRGRGGYDRGGFDGGRGGHGGHRGHFNGGNGGAPRFQPDPHRSSRGGSGGGDWRNPIAPHLAQYGGPPPPRGDFRPPPPQFGAYGGHPPPPPPGMGYPPGPPPRQQNGYQQFQGGRSNGHSQGYDGRRDNHYGGGGGGGGGRGGGGYRGGGGGGGGGRGGGGGYQGGGYQGGGGGGHRDYNNTYGHRHGDRHRDGHHGGGGSYGRR